MLKKFSIIFCVVAVITFTACIIYLCLQITPIRSKDIPTSDVSSTSKSAPKKKIPVGFFRKKVYYGISSSELKKIKGKPRLEEDILGATLEYNEKLRGFKCNVTYSFNNDMLTDVAIKVNTKKLKKGKKLFARLKKKYRGKKFLEYEQDKKTKNNKNIIAWIGFDTHGGVTEIELRKKYVAIVVNMGILFPEAYTK